MIKLRFTNKANNMRAKWTDIFHMNNIGETNPEAESLDDWFAKWCLLSRGVSLVTITIWVTNRMENGDIEIYEV